MALGQLAKQQVAKLSFFDISCMMTSGVRLGSDGGGTLACFSLHII